MKVLFLFAAVLLFAGSCNHKPHYGTVPLDNRQASIDISSLRESVPEFYTAVLEGKRVDFFLVMMNGEISSYFDACKECYFKKLGYHNDAGAMVCRACNVRFPLDRLNTGIGGCYPIRLKGTREGNTYVIAREDLEAGRKLF